MSYHLNSGFRNILLRRVRRHSNITTLFHSPSTLQRENEISTSQQSPGIPVDAASGIVQATLGGLQNQSATSSALTLPVTHTSPQNTQQGRTTGTPRVDAQQTVPSQSQIEVIQPAPLSETPSQSGLAQPSMIQASTTPSGDTDSSITDNVWQRLQTIFQRHQNKSSSVQEDIDHPESGLSAQQVADTQLTLLHGDEGSSASPQISTSDQKDVSQPTSQIQQTPRPSLNIQRSVDGNTESSPVDNSVEEEMQSVNPGDQVILPSNSDSLDDTELPAISENSDPKVQSQVNTVTPPPIQQSVQAQSPRSIQRQSATPVTSPGAPTPTGIPTPLHINDVQRDESSRDFPAFGETVEQGAVDQQIQIDQLESARITQGMKATQSIPSNVPPQIQRETKSTDRPILSPSGITPHSDASSVEKLASDIVTNSGSETEAQQILPLQDAWKVERILPEATSPEPTQAHRALPQAEGSIPRTLQDSISSILANVGAGGSTRSSIEIVAPRKPRPVSTYDSGQAQQPTIMRAVAPAQEQQAMQMSNQETDLAGAEDVVDTVIGPLPADLWTLIDEPVPSTARRQNRFAEQLPNRTDHAQPVSQTQSVNQNTTIQRAPTQDTRDTLQVQNKRDGNKPPMSISQEQPRPDTFRSRIPTSQTPPLIQRVTEQYGGETEVANTEQRSTSSPDEGSSAQEQQQDQSTGESAVDIDDIARKVYAEVKRKLTVEWERLRARF